MLKTKNENRLAGLFSCIAVFAFALVTVQSITASVSSVPDGLVGISITPAKATVGVGESIRLSAEGDYGTRTMPVRADWSLLKEGMGTLGACSNAKTCTFTAGDVAGATSVQAQVGDGKFIDVADILIEEKKEVLVNPFKDELPDWAFEAIVRMHQKGIVKGYDDGRYGPGDPVTNGQVITLLHRILLYANLIQEPTGCMKVYNDVASDHYAFLPACTFRRQGWSSDGATLAPDSASPRGVTAGFMNRTLGETLLSAIGTRPDGTQVFDDVPVGHPSFKDTAVTNLTGLMTGYPTGDFGVDDDLNRAAVAVIMFRILNKIEEEGISNLQGYDANAMDADAGHAAAPVVTKAACIVNADNGGSPRAGDPELGDGYVKLHLTEDYDIPSVRERCAGEYEALEARYCADARNSASRFQRGVLIYNADGSIRTGGGATRETQYQECSGAASSASSASSIAQEPPKDGTPCDDGNACTIYDVYTKGACTGTVKVCNDHNSCTTDTCDTKTSDCVFSPVNVGMACDDGNADTENDQCKTGKCVGTQIAVQDLCAGISCPDYQKCQSGYCVYKECSDYDGKVCSADTVCSGLNKRTSKEPRCCIGSCEELYTADTAPATTQKANLLMLKSYWTYYDFSAQNSTSYGTQYDFSISYETNNGQIGINRPWGANALATKIARPAKQDYAAITYLDCLNADYSDNYSAIMLQKPENIVCFQTVDGIVGKIGNASMALGQVHYTLWNKK
ncbi:hypothetical protein COU76_03065 [Candidatus Peregrinibacteria bacterium CG10_big_fil_rev_8_21_14_0_10_49_10]|nr:MAG: hypothetical protein COU76_03065 [Candidatus Peregrinibacteria bacterium CG10_big_fil_rev_8_21_14_0_10_49_10]